MRSSMEATTPGADRVKSVTVSTFDGFFDNTVDDFGVWALPGFNQTNLSEVGVYEEGTRGRNVATKLSEDGENVSAWDNLWRGIPLGIVLAFLCLLTTVGNIMVLHAVRTEKRLQTVSNLFIVSLAVADVIVGIIVMPMSAFYIFTERWMLGVAVCQIWIGVDYTASTASILNLFILSLDRYWSVRQPLRYLHKRTKRRALSMIAFVWAVSSLWIIPISSWHYFAHGGVRTVPGDECDTEYAKNSLFKVITAFFNFYLPLTVMYILYLRIFIAIRKRSEFELGQRNPGGTVLSYKANIPHSHSLDESEYNEDVSCSIENRLAGGGRVRENGTRSHLTSSGRNLRVLAVKRHQAPSSNKDTHSAPYKVEYIYDENVIDPQTEKIERYFYEEHYPIPCLARSTWVVGNDKFSSSSQRVRSPHQLRELKTSPRFQSTNSLASCSLKNPSPKEHLQPQHYFTVCSGSKPNLVMKKTLFRRLKKSNTSGLKPRSCATSESYRPYGPEETSFSPALYNDQTNASSSSSSSASTFEDRRSNDGGGRSCIDVGGRVGGACGEISRADNLKLPPRDFSVVGGVRKIRQAEPFLDRSTGGPGITSSSSVDGSSRNGDDSDGTLVLHDDKNRRLTSGMTGLKERLRTMRKSSSLNKEIKAARQLGVIMGAFTLCFLPYFILFLVVAFCDDCVKPGHLTAATWVGYLNSTLNPFLYPLCNANFRSKFRSMLSCCSRGRSHLGTRSQDYMERHTAFNSRYD